MKNIIKGVIGAVIVIGVIGYFLGWFKKEPEPVGVGNLIEVLEQRKLHLVKYKYLDMTFLHHKDNPNKRLVMIAKYPVSISAAVDLENIIVDNSNKTIKINEPELVEPNVKFEESEFYRVRDGFRLFVKKGDRERTLNYMKARVAESKERLKKDAIRLGILTQAKEEARKFIQDFLPSFNSDGYSVSFIPLEGTAANAQNDTLEIKMIGVEFSDNLKRLLQ